MWQTSGLEVATIIQAAIGAIVGTAGFVLGPVNYLRERPKIKIDLLWDGAVAGDCGPYNPNKLYAMIKVANIGRRPIFVSHASIRLPDGTNLTLMEGVEGKKLAEGDSPVVFMGTQDGLKECAKNWTKIRAEVRDSAGKVYRSPRQDKSKPPSWVTGQKPQFWRGPWPA